MAETAGNSAAARQRRALQMAQNTMIGREQGPELFHSQSVTIAGAGAQQIQIPRFVTLNRPLESIRVILSFRLAATVADYTSVFPEHFFNLLENFQLNGTHRKYGNLFPQRISGAMLYGMSSMFSPNGYRNRCSLIVNGVLANNVGMPYSLVGAAGTGVFLGTTATSPWDVQVVWDIPLGPIFPMSAGDSQRDVSFLYMPQDWADTLQIQLSIGDRTSLGVPAGGTVTAFSAFGSGAGSPSLEVHLNYSILGAFGNNILSGVLVRNEQTFTGFTALANSTRLSLLQKQITSNVIVKSGTVGAANAGITPFATLLDTQLGRTQIIVDNKPVRNNQNNMIAKLYAAENFDSKPIQGFLPFSFIDSQNPLTAYRGDGLAGGSTFEVDTDILTASASNIQKLVQEMIYGGPFPPLKPSM